jgi:hypothetical protein
VAVGKSNLAEGYAGLRRGNPRERP